MPRVRSPEENIERLQECTTDKMENTECEISQHLKSGFCSTMGQSEL